MSSAMEAQAPAFGVMDCALVRVAETTGRLDTVLDDLAGHLEAGDAFRQRITVASAAWSSRSKPLERAISARCGRPSGPIKTLTIVLPCSLSRLLSEG